LPGANKDPSPHFWLLQPDRFGVLLLVTAHFAFGSSAGQCFPVHEIVANNPLKSRVIGSNLNGILSFGFTSRWTIGV
jgi:hypothetical protein